MSESKKPSDKSRRLSRWRFELVKVLAHSYSNKHKLHEDVKKNAFAIVATASEMVKLLEDFEETESLEWPSDGEKWDDM